MAPHAIWRSRPIFITSTFRDFHAERDYLHRVVFPELEERLKARFHHLEPIDLRWGVETKTLEEQQVKELLILKVCLEEIERTRPFLIGLLGDRYGWVPPEDRIRAAAQEVGFETTVAGQSVTALEIKFGILADPGQQRRSRFYFREPLPYGKMDPSTAADYCDLYSTDPEVQAHHESLEALKETIREEMPDRVRACWVNWDPEKRRVADLPQWGRQVLEDLWADIEEETRAYAARPPDTWQDQERWTLEQFVETVSRDFVGRRAILEKLVSLALSPPDPDGQWGICLVGESGVGKSAVFAQLYHRLQQQEGVFLLAHAAGVSPRANQVDSLLRRWLQELAVFLGVADPAPDLNAREDLEKAFRELLAQASAQTPVVCLLDALNQFERSTTAQYLTWLPALWPPNARLIATTIPDTESAALEQRPGVESVPLDLMSAEEIEDMAKALCQRYHKTMAPEILQTLLSKQLPDGALAAGYPLWLALALEELLLLDADDYDRMEIGFTGSPEERLHALLLKVAGDLPPEIEALYAYLLERTEEVHGESWAREFAHLLAVTRGGLRESDLQVLLLRRAKEPWEEVRFAALRRSFRAHLVQRGALGQWDFVHAQMREAIFRRRLNTLEARGQAHQDIALYLEELPREDLLRQTELMFHLIAADDKLRAAHFYASLDSSDPEIAPASQTLAAHILAGAAEDPNSGLKWALTLPGQAGLTKEETANLCRNYQFALLEALANEAGLPLQQAFLEGIKQSQEGLLRQDPANPLWQRDLAVSYEKLGDVLEAQGKLNDALSVQQAALIFRQALLSSDSNDTIYQHDVTCSYLKVGDIFLDQRNFSKAEEAYLAAGAITERLRLNDPSDLRGHESLAAVQSRLGELYQILGDFPKALNAFDEAVAISRYLSQSDQGNKEPQRNLAVSHIKRAGFLFLRGDLPAALKDYREAEKILEELKSLEPWNWRWTFDFSYVHTNIGEVLAACGDFAAAHSSYIIALGHLLPLVQLDPDNKNWAWQLAAIKEGFGDAVFFQGQHKFGLSLYQEALEIRERLIATNPNHSAWQRDIAINYFKIGNSLQSQGDRWQAHRFFALCRELLRRLEHSPMMNDPKIAELSNMLSENESQILSLNIPRFIIHFFLGLGLVGLGYILYQQLQVLWIALLFTIMGCFIILIQLIAISKICIPIDCGKCGGMALLWRKSRVICPFCGVYLVFENL